jgi:mannose-6-phosphate isomerase-like protein (cupin superfamily)
MSTFDLAATYVHLNGHDDAVAIPVTESFWPELMSGTRDYDGRLITAHELSDNMTHWERHPAGGEVLIALSGAFDVILDEPGGERRIALDAGRAVIVPKNTWHRVDVREVGKLMFITPGEGTSHRPI